MCERELETEQNCNILTSTLLAITAFLSHSSGLLNQRPGGPALCWVLFSLHHFSNFSDPQTLNRGPEGSHLLGAGFLYHILSPNCLNFLCTQLYNSSPPTQSPPITGHRNMHFRRLWNGMFDRHRAEITVMQFTGFSLPVHQFVTVLWDFNPAPYCQSSSPTPMEYALPLLWNGMFGGVRGQYTTIMITIIGCLNLE